MAAVVFDDDAASALYRVLSSAAGVLGDQGWPRQVAVGTALEDFTGSYANLFTHTARAEADDRGRLCGVLADLATNILHTIAAAKQERQRQLDLTAWQKRDRERRRQEEAGGLAGALNEVAGWFDPHPSEHPVPCPTLNPVFSPAHRTRTSTTCTAGSTGGKSSADPDKLRTFVTHTQGANTRLDQELTRVRAAWRKFTTTCTWVPLGSVTFLGGFERYLTENQEDTTWIARIADAFQTAGGGIRLADVALNQIDLQNGTTQNRSTKQLLELLTTVTADELAQMLTINPALARILWEHPPTPAVVATWWNNMNGPAAGKPSAQQKTLINAMPGIIGNLQGVAYWARTRANLKSLNDQIHAQEHADTPNTDLLRALKAVRTALGKGLNENPPRELISLSTSGFPMAAISIGDLDTASTVSYLVPGMGTNVADNMVGYTNAAYTLGKVQEGIGAGPGPYAVVAWLNYQPPGGMDVAGVQKDLLAEAGAKRLVADMNGFYATRKAGNPNVQTSIVAHSYGTDVAAIALTTTHADHAVLLGSAGISTTINNASDLHVPAGQVFATQGHHDGWAPAGQFISGRTDPTKPSWGAHDFSSEAGTDAHGNPLHEITQHGPLAHTDTNDGYSYLDNKTTAQYNTARITVGDSVCLPVADTPDQRSALRTEDLIKRSAIAQSRAGALW